jgi:hypothetical protein
MKLEKIEHNGEVIYLKKDYFGYRIIEPVKDPETNKIIWKNVLSKKGFLTLGVLLIILLSLYLAFKEQLGNYNKVMDNPCNYCKTCQDYARTFIVKTNLSNTINYSFSLGSEVK